MKGSALFLLLAVASLALRGNEAAPMPSENDLGGWKAREAQSVYSPGNLFDYINGGAEIFIEFGFRELTLQTFKKGGHEVCVELYCMDSPEGALGIYYRQCGPNKAAPEDPFHIARSPFQWSLRKGNWYVQLNSPSGSAGLEGDLELFAKLILEKIRPRTVTIFTGLPTENRVANSEFLVRGPFAMQTVYTLGEGDILELGGKLFGVGASYLDGSGGKFTLLRISYPESETAAAVFSRLCANLDPYLAVISREATALLFRDYKEEFGIIRLLDDRLGIMLHLKSNPQEKNFQ